jgi:hypothetical protein
MDVASGSHINGQRLDEERGHIRKPSLGLSEHDGEDDDDNTGDYSARMEELFEEEDGEEAREDDEDDEEGFVYTGMDADTSTGDYRSQLRDVLGPEHDEDHMSELEVERSLLLEAEDVKVEFNPDDSQVSVSHSHRSAA